MHIINYVPKVYKYSGHTKVKILFELTDLDDDIYSLNKKLIQNKWMLKHLLEFYPFDYSYNMNLFADSLEATGKHILKDGDHVGSVKDGRRAMYAAHLIRNSYNLSMHDDKSLEYRRSKCTTSWKKIGKGMSMLHTEYLTANAMNMDPLDYDIAMSNIAYKRCEKQDEDKWTCSWNYIKKYIRHFWS